MLNILLPMAAGSIFFKSDEYVYPKPLIEIGGKAMIQWVVEDLNKIKEEKKFIFIVRAEDCTRFHIDRVLKLITDDNCEILQLEKETGGAACSCLMAIDQINNDDKLIVVNNDQIINENLNTILNHFASRKVDAGVICFEAVHPRWSFARLDENDKIIEVAEKSPISKNAIAGFYYFQKGSDFVQAAMKSIEKDASVDGLYYVAPVFNELVLEGKNLEIYKIKNENYFTFYSPQMVKEFEKVSNPMMSNIERMIKLFGKSGS